MWNTPTNFNVNARENEETCEEKKISRRWLTHNVDKQHLHKATFLCCFSSAFGTNALPLRSEIFMDTAVELCNFWWFWRLREKERYGLDSSHAKFQRTKTISLIFFVFQLHRCSTWVSRYSKINWEWLRNNLFSVRMSYIAQFRMTSAEDFQRSCPPWRRYRNKKKILAPSSEGETFSQANCDDFHKLAVQIGTICSHLGWLCRTAFLIHHTNLHNGRRNMPANDYLNALWQICQPQAKQASWCEKCSADS